MNRYLITKPTSLQRQSIILKKQKEIWKNIRSLYIRSIVIYYKFIQALLAYLAVIKIM